jgi:hypothetical protein
MLDRLSEPMVLAPNAPDAPTESAAPTQPLDDAAPTPAPAEPGQP